MDLDVIHVLHKVRKSVPVVSRHEFICETKIGEGGNVEPERCGLRLDGVVSSLVIALQCVFSRVLCLVVDGGLFGLLHEFVRTTLAFCGLFAILHLKTCEVEGSVIRSDHLRNLRVHISGAVDIVIACRKLCSV